MILKEELYKNVVMKFDVNEDFGTFSGSALGIMSSYKESHYGWSTLSEAREDLKTKIDYFLDRTPKTYKELAKNITSSLVWTGYEDCHADEQIIEILFENFIKYRENYER